jgi:hypothetical protein
MPWRHLGAVGLGELHAGAKTSDPGGDRNCETHLRGAGCVQNVGRSRSLALFTVALILALLPIEYNSVHLHVESEPIVPNTTVPWAASGNSTASVATFSWLGRFAVKKRIFMPVHNSDIHITKTGDDIYSVKIPDLYVDEERINGPQLLGM